MTERDNAAAGRAGIDPTFAAALDRFDVPPADDAFLARMGAMPRADLGNSAVPPRRRIWGASATGGRGAWARRASIGVIALGLASAGVAATGVFPALRLALPAPISAMLSPKPRPAAVAVHPHHPAGHAALAEGAAPPAPVIAPSPYAPLFGGSDPAAQLLRAQRRERAVDAIQARLAARGVSIEKPVIRQRLEMGQIAIGAAVRGDTTTPLPPGIARMRDRATVYLDNHPQLRERLQARAAMQDAEHARQTDAAPGDATAVPGADWTERRLRAFRRQQMMQRFWAAQRGAPGADQPQPGDNATAAKQNSSAGEGNAPPPR